MAIINGTTDHPQPWEGRCQVLSLDGGGLRGIFSAAVLTALEEDLDSPVLDHFDLVTGTSTGGLIALALGAGVPARSILEFFVEEGSQVFRAPRKRVARQFVRPKYNGRALDSALQRLFGDKLLGESAVRLVIPTFDMTRNDVYLLKTPHHPRLRRDWRVPMWEVARSTAAAPTYLPAHVLSEDRTVLVDGGVWANNPSLVGTVEAVSLLNAPLANIRLLNIGTTNEFRDLPRSLARGGLFQWLRGSALIDVLMTSQATGAFTAAQHLLGADHVERVNPSVPRRLLRLDRLRIDDAIAWASSASRYAAPRVQERFCDHISVPYQAPTMPKEASHA
ncbi:CBASS cGAMP-activated phospholipase [Candidatus Poriferisodalis sp.]|uniref:CBASS cGAMP-activated phospholipase n=1 Tax=Candidatus Poriferisodalis sp. TaxID=3101277 RepID=UPI003B526F17